MGPKHRCQWVGILGAATLVALALAAGWAGGQERVEPANGDFEQGTEGWKLSQQEEARADFTVVDGDSPARGRMARIEVIQPGDPHRLQLVHNFDTALLSVGEAYELRFWARSDRANSIRVNVFNADRPWSTLGLSKEVDLGPEWREYRLPFRVRETPQQQSKVDFFLGTCEGVVWLDGVVMTPFERRPIEGGDLDLWGSDDWSASISARGALARFSPAFGSGEVIGAEEDPIYELTLVDEGVTRTLTDRDALNVARLDEGMKGLTFRYEHEDIVVECSIARGFGSLMTFEARVMNSSEAAVTALRYPLFRTPIQLGDAAEDDAILIPAFDGGICENPKESVPAQGGGFGLLYPGPASCQLMAYYDRDGGVYMAAYDPAGYPKRFRLDTDVDFVFSFEHLFPTLPGESVEMTYPVVLGAVGGLLDQSIDWYDAAEIYRRWSRQQPWCQTPLTKKTPEWLARGALVTDFDPRNFPLERLESHLGRFMELYDAPLIPNSRGWERWGMWTGQEYLPPLPSEEHFGQAGDLIRRLDGRGMVMLSGYRWTIEKKQADGSLYSCRERFDREVRQFVTCDADGQPIIHTSEREDDWHGQKWAVLCRETEFAKQTIAHVAAYCVGHGYPVIHFDQEVSGNYAAGMCGSREHGHPPGNGRYVHLALDDLYRRIRARCEPIDPDFVLSMEEPNELYLPYLDLCQCRPFGLTREWPAVSPMTRTVPLFSFLYHDYLIQWAAFYPWKSAGHPEISAAKGFAAGLMPGLHPYDYTLPAEGTTPYSEFFARCMAMYLGAGREYLIFGRMRGPLPIEVPTREIGMGRQWGKTTVPAFFHSVWELDDGRIGVVFANPGNEEHAVTIDREWLRPGWPREATPLPPEGADWGERELEVVVPARDAIMVETTPWGKPA